jgi:hypothetical protein
MNASTPAHVRAFRGLISIGAFGLLHTNALGQIFVANGVVGEYSNSGATINSALIPDGNEDVALLGSRLFTLDTTGTIGEYTTSGAVINASLISGPADAYGFAVSGSDIFVANSVLGTVAEYTTSGATVNSSLITGLSSFVDIDVSGSDLFVANNGNISEYTTSGTLINADLVSGIIGSVVVVSGSNLFVSNSNGIGEYTTSGATVNASLVSGPFTPGDVAVSGSDLFVGDGGTGIVSEYTTSGALINPALITGLPGTVGLAIEGSATVPEGTFNYAPFLAVAFVGFAMIRRKPILS